MPPPCGAKERVMNKITKAVKLELDPNNLQIAYFERCLLATRLLYNAALARYIAAKKIDPKIQFDSNESKQYFRSLKKTKEWNIIQHVHSHVVDEAFGNLRKAFSNWGKRYKKGVGFPVFKKYGVIESFSAYGSYCEENYITIPGCIVANNTFNKKIRLKERVKGRHHEGDLNSAVISRRANRWFISFTVKQTHSMPNNTGPKVGIDLGIKSFCVLSNGETVLPQNYLRKSERKMKRLQRSLSRKKKGSKNRAKAQRRVARLHFKIANQRLDFQHKLSHRLSTEFSGIAVENLNVKGMMMNRRLSKSISDQAWSEFKRQLNYKTEWNGSEIRLVNRFFPSSRICFDCGYKNNSLKQSDRSWSCTQCGSIHDRDLNAAHNILIEAYPECQGNVLGNEGKPGQLSVASKETLDGKLECQQGCVVIDSNVHAKSVPSQPIHNSWELL